MLQDANALSARLPLPLPAGAAYPRAIIKRLPGLLCSCGATAALVAIPAQLCIPRRLW